MVIIRPLDKYLSINSMEKNLEEECFVVLPPKLKSLNKHIKIVKQIKDEIIDEIILLIKKNSPKRKQFLKEQELKECDEHLSELLIKKQSLLLEILQ